MERALLDDYMGSGRLRASIMRPSLVWTPRRPGALPAVGAETRALSGRVRRVACGRLQKPRLKRTAHGCLHPQGRSLRSTPWECLSSTGASAWGARTDSCEFSAPNTRTVAACATCRWRQNCVPADLPEYPRRPVTVDTLASSVVASLLFDDVKGIHDFKGMDALDARLEKKGMSIRRRGGGSSSSSAV